MKKILVMLAIIVFSSTIALAAEPTAADIQTRMDALKGPYAQLQEELAIAKRYLGLKDAVRDLENQNATLATQLAEAKKREAEAAKKKEVKK